MNTIISNKKLEYTINKSKFISFIYYVENEEQVQDILNKLKKEYADSTHICYAYIVDEINKYNDDKEPVAALPMLNILKGNNLNYVLSVIVRYFGGIKLGVGGLSRAYSNGTKIVIENNTKPLIEGYLIDISFDYDKINNIDFLLKDTKIIEKKFEEKINYVFLISCSNYENIKEKLNQISTLNNIIFKKNV